MPLWAHIVCWILMAAATAILALTTAQDLRERGIAARFDNPTVLGTLMGFLGFISGAISWVCLEVLYPAGLINHPVQTLLPAYFLTPFLLNLLWVDAAHHILPNRLLLPAAVGLVPLLCGFALYNGETDYLIRTLTVPLVYGALLLVMTFFGLGMGDVKLGMLMAAWMGFYNVLSPAVVLFIASIGLGLFALFMVASRRANIRSRLAFGPWMILGLYLTWVLNVPLGLSS